MEAPSFELPNVGVGPDPLSLSRVQADVDFAVLFLLRDYHCPKCKAQVQRVAERAADLQQRDAAPIAILPEPRERTQSWQETFELPFPLLADPEAAVGEGYDQPTRFGALGELHDLLGRMPKTVVLDLRADEPEVVHVHEGETPADRADPDDLLSVIDDLRESFVFDCSLVEC